MAHPCTAQVLPPIFQGRPLAGPRASPGGRHVSFEPREGAALAKPIPAAYGGPLPGRAPADVMDYTVKAGQLPAQVRREPGPWAGMSLLRPVTICYTLRRFVNASRAASDKP